jgi:two-component system sensor histidine kinase TtrS
MVLKPFGLALVNRGREECLKKWNPTATYLGSKIPECQFEIIPLSFDDFANAVKNHEIDFLICNSGLFVEMEASYGVTSIATLKTKAINGYYSVYGGVIFAKADSNIRTLGDLKGKRFMAVDADSYGGWLCALRELRQAGLDPGKDSISLSYGGTHDAVVRAVLSGKVDAGTCRTGVIEDLAAKNDLNLTDLRILVPDGTGIQQPKADFPLLNSTRLYPEWAFAKLNKTSPALAMKVAIALLGMDVKEPSAVAANCGGWSYPLNYQEVHNLMKELRIGHYKYFGLVEFRDVIRQYWAGIITALMIFALVVGAFILVSVFYKRLAAVKKDLETELCARQKAEQESAKLIIELREALSQVNSLSGIIPICAGCKQIRDDKGYWNRVEAYVEEHSLAKFSHSLCPECAKTYFPNVKI